MDQDAELARLAASPLGVPVETDLLGFTIEGGDGPTLAAQFDEIFRWEAYSFDAPHDEPIIVDGGANVGLASIWWKSRWPRARVVAFEPDPALFLMLASNLRHHDPERVELRRAAIAGETATMRFVPEGTDAGRLAIDDDEPSVEVAAQSLRSIVEELGHVDLLKLDIEGAETRALLAAEPVLDRVDRIFVEYHSFVGKPQELAALVACLERSGFRFYLETPQRRVRPFTDVEADRRIDYQGNIWASR